MNKSIAPALLPIEAFAYVAFYLKQYQGAIYLPNSLFDGQVAEVLVYNRTINASGGSLALNSDVALNGHTLTLSGTVTLHGSVLGEGAIANSGSLLATSGAAMAGDLTSTGVLAVGVGAGGSNPLAIAGNATLSGVLDVVVEPSVAPSGSFAVLTAGGVLDAEDAKVFGLVVVGNSLFVVANAVPEPKTATLLGLACLVCSGAVRRRTHAARLNLPRSVAKIFAICLYR